MKKALKIGLVAIVVVFIATLLIVGFKLGGIIKAGVETVGPKFTGAPITLDKAFVRPFSGKAQLKGLVVSNPEGYKTPSAFELGEVYLKLDPRSVTSDTIIIEEIRIVGPVITYEKPFKKSNIAQILANVEAMVGPAEEEKKGEKSEKKVVINHVVVEGAKVRLSTVGLGGKALPLPLPKVELHGIGKEKEGTSFAEALTLILKAVLKSVTKVVIVAGELAIDGAKVVGDAAIDGATVVGGAAVDGAAAIGDAAADGVKAVGDVAADGAKAIGGAAADGAKALTKGVGGLLGRGKEEDEEEAE